MAELNLDGNGAAYIRVSEPTQDPRRQKSAIDAWLERHNLGIAKDRWYEDIGWARDKADTRPDFQRLISAVQEGQIQWIIVDAHDRFGTTDKYQLFSYLHLLREAGCRLLTIDDEEMTADDFAASINVLLKGEESEKERRTKSQRVLGAMRELALQGEWQGGYVPFGFDVVCFGNKDMKERWRVRMRGLHFRFKISSDGQSIKGYHGKGNFPAKENDEVLQLRPTTDESHLQVVREIFERFANESVNFNQIARQLNLCGGPKPHYSNEWEYHHIRDLLQNPIYVGQPTWNKNTHGKFSEWRQNRQHRRKPGMKQRPHERADWVTTASPLFDPIVSTELFSTVQAKMATRPQRPRAPKSHELWLSGLVYCAKCGKPMNGKVAITKGKKTRAVYICSTYVRWSESRDTCPCQVNAVPHHLVEEHLLGYLKDAGQQLDDLVGSVSKANRKIKPDALKQAIKNAAEAYQKMLERVGAELVVHESTANGVPPTFFQMDCAPELYRADDTESLEGFYRSVFNDQKADIEFKLDDLKAEQDELLETIKKIPLNARRALAKVQERLSEIDAEMSAAEVQLANAADEFEAAQKDCERFGAEWEAAKTALETEASARGKAEAVRRVVDRIVLTFQPTGQHRPTSELVRLEFVPVNPRSLTCQSLHEMQLKVTGQISQQTSGSPSP